MQTTAFLLVHSSMEKKDTAFLQYVLMKRMLRNTKKICHPNRETVNGFGRRKRA